MSWIIRYIIALLLLGISGGTIYLLFCFLKAHYQEGGNLSLGNVEIAIGIGLMAIFELLIGVIYIIDGQVLVAIYKEPAFLVPLFLIASYFFFGLYLNLDNKKKE